MHYPTRHPLPTLEDRIVAHLSLSPATRSQLCEALDTSRTNLGRALTTLLDEGSVVPVRSNAPGRGRPTQLLTLNASAAHAVGLLVTRTSCAAVMLSRSGTVLASAHIVSPASPTLLECLEQTCEALSASATSQGIDVSRVRAVGVGAPIPMGRHARVASDVYPSVEDVASVTGRWWQATPVVDNTVRMAAFAEGLWGAGSGMSSFIYLRLSGGVGGCVVSDFRLVGGATGLSLIIVGLTAAVSLATRARSGSVAWREGTIFALAGLAGTWAGAALAPLVSARTLMLSFCALLVAVAIFMVRSQLHPSASPSSHEAGAQLRGQRSWTLATVGRVVALATLTGFLTGFFGVGGGFVIVPALHLALRYPMRRASATSLLVMVITAAFGLVSRTLSGTLTITAEAGAMVALFAGASMVGGFVGARLTARVSNRVLGLVFAALLIIVAASTLAATLA